MSSTERGGARRLEAHREPLWHSENTGFTTFLFTLINPLESSWHQAESHLQALPSTKAADPLNHAQVKKNEQKQNVLLKSCSKLQIVDIYINTKVVGDRVSTAEVQQLMLPRCLQQGGPRASDKTPSHTKTPLSLTWALQQQNPAGAAHLVGAVRHGEGELVGVLLLFAAVNILDAAGRQLGLREGADSGACRRARERERETSERRDREEREKRER